MTYIPIHVHTDRSNNGMKDSVNRLSDILNRLRDIGSPAWACTDHGTMSNIVNAYKASTKAGLKFIPGYEGYLTADLGIKQSDLRHITLWAKDNTGLQNLNRIATVASGDKGKSPDNFYRKPRVDVDLLRRYSEGLMVGSACLGGWGTDEALLCRFIDIFGKDSVFLEIHTYQGEGQREHNETVIELAKKYDVLTVVATDAHFTYKKDFDLHKAFKNTSKTVEGDENLGDTLYIQDVDEIRASLQYLPSNVVEQSIANTHVIADRCNVIIDFSSKHYPHFPCDDENAAVRQKCIDAWSNLIASGKDANVYGKRIKAELEVLNHQGYCGYFLITGDYMESAVNKGIPIGPGRGSAGGSLVAKLCGITRVDSVELGLAFERFAHNERMAPADIDVDVSQRRRNEVIDYIRSKYGEVYQVRTFSTMAPAGAIRLAGRALEWNNDVVDVIAKSLTKYENDDEDDDISVYQQQLWKLNHIRTDDNAELIDLARRFVGMCTGYGKHASAVLILDKDISQFCSVERQTDSKTKEAVYIAACEYPLLEAQGLMKADVLGLKTLDVIDDTVKATGIDIEKIPLDCPNTSEMLCMGKTAGCFQIESPGMTKLVKQIRPRSFNDLIPLVALYRPGPLNAIVEPIEGSSQYPLYLQWKQWQQWTKDGNDFPDLSEELRRYKPKTMVQTYVSVKNWTELQQWIGQGNSRETWPHWDTVTEDDIVEPFYLHEKLRPILEPTYSIILYQEQILEIAKELCGYTMGEADNLRRIIGKKKLDEMGPAIATMIERGVACGVHRDIVAAVAKQITEFASYCFGKAHSAAYGLLSYQTGYLKANYPLQYMAALLNSENNVQDKVLPYIKECTKLGIAILPPDIRLKNREFIVEDNAIRIGLHYIKGIGNNLSLDSIETFESIISSNPKDVVTGLIKAGAMDSYGDRGTMLASLTSTADRIKRIANCTAKIQENQDNLATAANDKDRKKYQRQLAQWQAKLADAQQEQTMSTMEYDSTIGEIEVLGYSEGVAPNVKVGKLVNVFSKVVSNGKTMAWLTLKSDYGEFRCAVFEEEWLLFKDKVTLNSMYRFVCKETNFGYNLEEIHVDGVTYVKQKKGRR